MEILKNKIRTIPNFPKSGIQFRDITTLLSDFNAFKLVIDSFAEHYKAKEINYIAGIESRGFIIGAPLSLKLGKGFIPIRKAGKLPGLTHKVEYNLEYGSDSLELHKDSFEAGSKVLIVDDLLATGGTVDASTKLIEKAGGLIAGYAFVIELVDLNGRENLDNPIFSLVQFEED
tara:strand:+ start:145 stop:666 length:522 start_codon:yes stop_codon:yes gene_type:complete